MISIEWTNQAFEQLEELPDAIVIEIIPRVELLATFPELGASLQEQLQTGWNYRQLIVKRQYRIIYRYDSDAEMIYIAAIQHCRQQPKDFTSLQRAIKENLP